MPNAFAKLLVPVAAGLVAGGVLLAGLIASNQRSPGGGVWDDRPTTLDGVVTAEPYALLRVSGAGGPETVLLVEEGKFGAKERVRPFDGRAVRVSGTLLHRDGVRVMEVSAGEEGVRPIELPDDQRAGLARPAPTPIGRVTLVGEVIDPKCYLGAMKPGGGRTHKGCAALCLRGGVPPMFVSRDGDGRPTYHLLTAADSGPLPPALFDKLGDVVSLTAEEERWDDLPVLKVGPRGVAATHVTRGGSPVRPR